MILQKTPADHVEMPVATAAPVVEPPVVVALHGLHDLVNVHQSLFTLNCTSFPAQPHSTNLFPLLTRKPNSVAILGKKVLNGANHLTEQIVLSAFYLQIYLDVNLDLKYPFLKLVQTFVKCLDHAT